MAGKILQRPELAGGATVNGVEVIAADGGIVAPVIPGDIPLTSAKILVGNGSNVAAAVSMSGDATIANTGAVTIANSAVTNAKVSASAAIDYSKLATLTSGNILVGSAGNVATSVAMSGDATISNTGVVTNASAAGAFNVATTLSFTKEGSRNIGVAPSTTADTVGGALAVRAGGGFGAATGGALTVSGGVSGSGATGAGGAMNVVGGDCHSTNGNGGDVVITGGALSGSGFAGNTMNRSPIWGKKQSAPTAKTTSATLTAAEVKAGIITINQGGAGASAQQLPTVADLETALPGFTTDDSFDISVINISVVDAEDATITTNTGWTLVGSMDFLAYNAAGTQSSGILRLRKTGAGAWTAYRIA